MSKELIDGLPGGIVLLDEAGNITLMNAPAEYSLGYAPGELVGQPFTGLLTVAGRLFCQTHFYPLVNLHGRVDELALTLVTRTGERMPILLNALRRQRADGWDLYCVYLPLVQRHQLEAELIQSRRAAEEAQAAVQEREAQYRDLATHLEEQVRLRTEQLARANEELAATNAELITSNAELANSNHDLTRSNDNLEQFAYVASHDLQEPLRKIQQFGDILKTQYVGGLGEGVLYLERMQSAAARMSTLIKDLLSFSRISTRQETASSVSLTEVVGSGLTNLELLIGETGAVVAVSPLPVVAGDRSQLGQLFENLLSNALKFRRADTPPIIRISSQPVGAVDLPATVRPTRWAETYYCIEVADNGIGFDEKYIDRIFQVFQRLHGKGEYAGTGIGLAICEKVAANHGGTITARSQPGQGATFQVYLPV